MKLIAAAFALLAGTAFAAEADVTVLEQNKTVSTVAGAQSEAQLGRAFGQTWQCLQQCTYQSNATGAVWSESAVSYCYGDGATCVGTCNPTSATVYCY